MKHQTAISTILLAMGCHARSLSTRDIAATVEDVIVTMMEKYHTPGAAIAVVSGNETWSKGFGYADIGKNSTVDPSTLFFIGSTTKSHTAAAISLLVDQGLLDWNTPLQAILGDDFEIMDNEWATRHLTVTDILSHRTGIPRYDMAIKSTSVENVRSLRHLPLSTEPRTTWQYSNHNYGVAGYLVEKITGTSLEDFITENLWKPIGMNRTYLNRQEVAGLATSYSWNNDTNSSEPRVAPNLAGLEAAGAMVSNVDDFAKYLQVMMRVTDGPISTNGLGAILGNHMLLANSSTTPGIFTGPAWYGLGWNGGVLNGVLTYNHGGDIGQFGSYMWIFPEIQTGFIVMTNQMGAFLEEVGDRLAYALLEIGEDEQVDVESLAGHGEMQREFLLENCITISYPILADISPDEVVSDKRSLDKYVGNYIHPGFDNITISVDCPTGNLTSQVMGDNSPAKPTFDGSGCLLRTGLFTSPGEGFQAELQYVGTIPMEGEAWMAWIYALGREGYYRPQYCMMVVFSDDEAGNVVALSANARLEPGTTLFAFNKSTADGSAEGITVLSIAPKISTGLAFGNIGGILMVILVLL